MKKEDRYTDAPREIAESLARSVQIEDFLPSAKELMRVGVIASEEIFFSGNIVADFDGLRGGKRAV
jgi:hypothetical protein